MQTIKVHIADDHQVVVDGILAFLEKEKEIEVIHTANNGMETLEKLKEAPVDVVILDINMPVMTGVEAAKHILRHYTKTKILLLTMHGESKFIVNALKTGVDGYVTKEKSKEYLVGAIHSVYRGAKFWSPEILANIANMTDEEEENELVKFTEREYELLCLMVKNQKYSSEQLGVEMYIASATVDSHINNMKSKIKATKRIELITYALRNKICE